MTTDNAICNCIGVPHKHVMHKAVEIDAPISPPRRALEDTPLCQVADILLHLQRRYRRVMVEEDNHKLAEARILVDVLRGDGQ